MHSKVKVTIELASRLATTEHFSLIPRPREVQTVVPVGPGILTTSNYIIIDLPMP